MPRRNLYLLLVICLISGICYRKADSAHRSRYGRMFNTFTEMLKEIDARYVEKVDDRELFEGALQGVVNQLDENSSYLNPTSTSRQRQSLEQEFGGIGIEVTFDRQTNLMTVVTPLIGSPAFLAGVLPGDMILAIDDEETDGFSFEDAVKRLRGKVDEPVKLKVLHVGEEEPVELNMRRKKIQVSAISGDHRTAVGEWDFELPSQDHLGYVRVSNFGKRTLEDLETALKKLSADNVRGLILDLRNNGGGLLDEAVSVCNLFISEGRIVTVKGREGNVLGSHSAAGKAPYATLPLVVLINERSASASEIVAACLQDHQRATIVGQRSFGKGTVQEIYRLEEGTSALKLTIATYWRPNDKNIHRGRKAKETDEWGVMPEPADLVKLSPEEQRNVARARRDRDLWKPTSDKPAATTENVTPPVVDRQLQRAIEALKLRIPDAPAKAA